MDTEQPNLPPPTPLESGASADIAKAFEGLRGKFNALLDDATGAKALAAVRCGGGCHQGVID